MQKRKTNCRKPSSTTSGFMADQRVEYATSTAHQFTYSITHYACVGLYIWRSLLIEATGSVQVAKNEIGKILKMKYEGKRQQRRTRTSILADNENNKG